MSNGKEESSQVPTGLLITFTACTTLLVSVHMLALMISTCILPNVDAVASVNGLAAVCIAFIHFTSCFDTYISSRWKNLLTRRCASTSK